MMKKLWCKHSWKYDFQEILDYFTTIYTHEYNQNNTMELSIEAWPEAVCDNCGSVKRPRKFRLTSNMRTFKRTMEEIHDHLPR